MADRLKNHTWSMSPDPFGKYSTACAQLGVLQDIRDELQTLNRTFGCHNAQEIPKILREIRRNTTKRKKRKKAV